MTQPSTANPKICFVDEANLIPASWLEGLTSIQYEIGGRAQLREMLNAGTLELVIITQSSPTPDETEACAALSELADQHYRGWVVPCVQKNLRAPRPLEELAQRLGLRVLPPLELPSSREVLQRAINTILEICSRGAAAKISDALKGRWLELWYQPKIHTGSLLMKGAEALLRIKHPTLGMLPPNFVNRRDPQISDFVVRQAIADWKYLYPRLGHIETAINLPIDFFRIQSAVDSLCQLLSDDRSFRGFLIEIDSTEISANLQLAGKVADELRPYKLAISVDDTGEEWPSLSGLRSFPFVEIKVDQTLIVGCSDDPSKRSVCRHIVQLADTYGARTVAEGVETWADFLTVRELGFDLVQGFLFAEPMRLEELVQTCWSGRGNAFADEAARASRLPDIIHQALLEGERR